MAAIDLIDPTNLLITTDGEGVKLNPRNPEFYLHENIGRIYLYSPADNEEDDEKILVGGFRLTYIDIASAVDNEMPLGDIFDTSQDLTDIYEAVYEEGTWDYKPKVNHILGKGIFTGDNILSIDRLGILPEYRGNHIGLFVLSGLIQRYSVDTSFVAIHPYPLFFYLDNSRNDFCWDGPEGEPSQANIQKLKAYYKKVGFKTLRGSDLMLLSPVFGLSKIQDIFEDKNT